MKKVFKVIGIIAAAIFGMILYTNAFPIDIKIGEEWEEVSRIEEDISCEQAADMSRTSPNYYCYNYDTDQFWIHRTNRFYWKGFEVHFNTY